jgi:hypothetical protein
MRYRVHSSGEEACVSAIRVHIVAEADGEISLHGLPIRRGQEADVIVLTDAEEVSSDAAVLAILQHDPSWVWLREPAEDIYSEQDVR